MVGTKLVTKETTTNQNAVDKHGVVFNIRDVSKGMVLYHIITGEQMVNVLDVTAQIAHFRLSSEHTKSGGNPKESQLHKYIKGLFSKKYITNLNIDGFNGELTNCSEEQRITVLRPKPNNTKVEIQHFIPDVIFDECIVEVVVTTIISEKKRMFFESVGLPIIIIDFSQDKRKSYNIYKDYNAMSIKEASADVVSRCRLLPPVIDEAIIPYVKKLDHYNSTYKDILLSHQDRDSKIIYLEDRLSKAKDYFLSSKEESDKLKQEVKTHYEQLFKMQSIIDSLKQNKEGIMPLLAKVEAQKQIITKQAGTIGELSLFNMKNNKEFIQGVGWRKKVK